MLIDRRSSTIRPWLLTVTDEEFRERIEAAADSLWNAHCNRNRMQVRS